MNDSPEDFLKRHGFRKLPPSPLEGTPKGQCDDNAPAFSDEAIALRFAVRHANELRYVAAWSKWLAWDGARWRFDDTLHVFDHARHICREAAAACNRPKIALAIASAKTSPPSRGSRALIVA